MSPIQQELARACAWLIAFAIFALLAHWYINRNKNAKTDPDPLNETECSAPLVCPGMDCGCVDRCDGVQFIDERKPTGRKHWVEH